MKLLHTIPLALVLAFGAFGARTARADETSDMKKFMAFFDKIVDTVVKDQDSCPKMATDINALIDANKDVLEMAKKYANSKKEMPPEMKKHMQDQIGRMMPGIQKCGRDKGVQAAFQRLDVGPHHAPPAAH